MEQLMANNGRSKESYLLYSRPLKTVIETLAEICKQGVGGIWICGAVISPIEVIDKHAWLKANCNGIKFDSCNWIVSQEYWTIFAEYFNFSGYETESNCAENKYVFS